MPRVYVATTRVVRLGRPQARSGVVGLVDAGLLRVQGCQLGAGWAPTAFRAVARPRLPRGVDPCRSRLLPGSLSQPRRNRASRQLAERLGRAWLIVEEVEQPGPATGPYRGA
jgi:hypothetical protein